MKELDIQQQLMVITMEECSELIQVCSKILRQATYEEKRQELIEELGDLQCMINLMHEWDVVSYSEIEERAEIKREKLTKWSDLV
tara:strand:- start:4703 stop:4957 length:255 start_codon:yes stop_codon:yes gene_type:complete